ncbi:MAG: glycogen-binding domain-containing protein, partial [Gemmatimonadales bacterium]
AMVAAAGRSGSDPVTSVPGARNFALGLRLKVGPPVLAPAPAPAAASATTPFRIGPAVAAGREVVIQARDAQGVELAGDFTDWKPIPLQPWGDDGWRALFSITPGLHRLAIRIDGGAWQAPPGTRPVTSEFGGEVAEVAVE